MPSRSERKLLRSLAARKGREEHGLFLAEGPRLLAELLDSGLTVERVLHTAAVAGDPGTGVLLERARRSGARAQEIGERELAALADAATPQGVLAVARLPVWGWAEVAADRVLVLDGVQDPGNVGTLLRTAEAMAVGGVVLLPGTADPWSPKVVRAAAGSAFRLPFLSREWPEALAAFRERGHAVWAAEPGGEPLRRGEAVPARLALVLGSEGAGLSPEVRTAADRLVALPLAGGVDSLNVAVAGAILLDRLADRGA